MNGTIKGASQGTMPNEQDDGSTITTTAKPKMLVKKRDLCQWENQHNLIYERRDKIFTTWITKIIATKCL